VVSFHARCAASLDRLLLFWEEFYAERGYYRLGNFILDRENIREIAVVSIGPDVSTGRSVNQLRRYPNSIARLANATFEHMCDPNRASVVLHFHYAPLEREPRVTGYHHQRRHLRNV